MERGAVAVACRCGRPTLMVMRCAPDVLTGSASTRPLWKLKARLQLDKLLGMTDVHARAPHTTRRPGTRAGTRAPDWLIEDVAVHAEAAADHLDAQRLARDPAVDLLHRGALRELCGRDGSAPRRIDFHRSASELFASTDAQLNRRASSRDRDAAARARCTSALAVSCCAHLDPPGARYGTVIIAIHR